MTDAHAAATTMNTPTMMRPYFSSCFSLYSLSRVLTQSLT